MKSPSSKSTKFSPNTRNFLILSVILVVALIVRIYQFNASITDTSSDEQSKILLTASDAVKNGNIIGRYNITPLEEKLNNADALKYNPSHLLLYERATMFLSTTSGMSPHLAARLINIVAFLIFIAVAYLLVLKYQSVNTAIIVALSLSLSPYAVFQSRQINAYVVPLMLITASMYLAYLIIAPSKNRMVSALKLVLSMLLASLSIAMNPIFAVFLLPLTYLLYKRFGLDLLRGAYFYLYMFGVLVPVVFINIYQNTLPSLLPLPIWSSQVDYLSSSSQLLFFDRHFIETILVNKFTITMLGGFGLGFVIIGILKKSTKLKLTHYLMIAGLINLILFPEGHLNSTTFGLIFILPVAVYFSSGINLLRESSTRFTSGIVSTLTVIFFVGLSAYLSWGQVGPLYKVDSDMLQIAKIINTLTTSDDLIATDTKGDPTILYLSDRKGIPTTDNGDDELVANGVSYLVTSNSGYAEDLAKKYNAVFATDKAFIFKLK